MKHNELVEMLEKDLKERLNPTRYRHTNNVVEIGLQLGKIYRENLEDIKIAAILHDYTKHFSVEENNSIAEKYGFRFDEIESTSKELQHSKTSAIIAKEVFSQKDEIVNAIAFHTTGRENMTLLEKIIFVADAIEKDRNYLGIEALRKLAMSNLDQAILRILDNSILYLVDSNKIIHPNTIYARNFYLNKFNEVV